MDSERELGRITPVKKVIGLVVGFGLIFAALSSIASAQTVSPSSYLHIIQSGSHSSPSPAPNNGRERDGRRR